MKDKIKAIVRDRMLVNSIPTPAEIIDTVYEKDYEKISKLIQYILNDLKNYDGTNLKCTYFQVFNDKAKNKIKSIFSEKNWNIELHTVFDQRDGNYTEVILSVKNNIGA